jgi:uncharacterized protein YcfJ
LIKEKGFRPAQIGCMDELALHLTPALRDKRVFGAGTGAVAGATLLKQHGLKDAQAAIIIATTAEGNLLPPFIILKVICW